ncbi:SDR family oxidoreductase [Streptomyces sp. NPDC049936]|uniref:SDR family oxidoreductase n=1 Tax=Streptomyces sp. NPDC049936 TaxID=3365599 RepID=UPI0037A0F9CB
MNINGSIALVTGANRGLGRAFSQALLARGASKVYAAARRPETVDLPGVVPLRLDITDQSQVAEAAARADDVTLLVNNAGIFTAGSLVRDPLDGLRAELDTQLFGTLHMMRSFAPILGANGGGAIVNVLSAMSWFAYDGGNAYHVSKAAAWAATNGARIELTNQGTLVVAVHLGLADTDMAAASTAPKLAPSEVAEVTLNGVEQRRFEVLADDWSRTVKASLAGDPAEFYGTTEIPD